MASIAEIRQQYPQYSDLSDQQLADALHKRYYADMPAADFYQKIGLKTEAPQRQYKASDEDARRYLELSEAADPSGYKRATDLSLKAPDTIREIPNKPFDRYQSFLGDYVDTAMLGTADEVLAGVYGLGAMVPGGRSPGEAFQEELARLEQTRRDQGINSGQRAAATATGVVLNPLNLTGGRYIAEGANAGWRAGRAAVTGGGIGTTSGFFGTEGDLADRAVGAGVGGGLGLAIGGAAQPAAELVGVGARKGAEGVRAVANTITNNAQAKADPVMQANKLIARALIDDGMLPILPARTPLPGQGMVNLGGENLIALGRQATVAPGQGRTIAREFFDEQAGGQADRAADALRGLSERGYYGTLETLDAGRRTAAAPLYNAAYARPAVDAWTPRLAELLQRPSMRAAYERAARIAAEEGRSPTELGLVFNEAGDPVFLAGARNGQIPSTQTLDYVKRGLDDVMQAQPRDPATGRIVMDEGTRAIDNTRREFVGILRQGNPEYAAALDAWGGPSHSIEVMDLGRQLFRQSGNPADAIRRFQALPPADQEYARIGFMRDALAKVGNVSDGGSVYQALFNTPNKRALAETMFPDRASFERFAAQMNAERQMVNANRTIMGGSPTSRIDADKAAMSDAENTLGIVDAIRSGSVMRLLAESMQRGKNMQQGVTPEVAAELARRLFTANPGEIGTALTAAMNVPVPAPLTALPPGWFRNTPLAPMLGQIGGQAGQFIGTPPPQERLPARAPRR